MMDPSWLIDLLRDPDVTDICMNGGQSIQVDRGEGLRTCRSTQPFIADDLRKLCLSWLAQLNRSWDARYPFVQIQHPTEFHRIHILLQSEGCPTPVVSIRRTALCPSISRPAHWGLAEPECFGFLAAEFAAQKTLLISGATGSGKTTLLNELLQAVPNHERVLALEDLPELSPQHPGFLRLLARGANADGHGAISLRQLVRESLRMRPDRIVMGECRGAEAWDLIQLMNTGHRGSAATLHANTPRDALRRLELLAQLAQGELGMTISQRTVREFLANGIDWVVQVNRTDRGRKITDVQQVVGLEGDIILLRPMIKCQSETRHEVSPYIPSGFSASMGPPTITRGA